MDDLFVTGMAFLAGLGIAFEGAFFDVLGFACFVAFTEAGLGDCAGLI